MSYNGMDNGVSTRDRSDSSRQKLSAWSPSQQEGALSRSYWFGSDVLTICVLLLFVCWIGLPLHSQSYDGFSSSQMGGGGNFASPSQGTMNQYGAAGP